MKTDDSEDLISELDPETKDNINGLDSDLCDSWSPSGCIWSPCNGKYIDKTVVRSGDDAINAFQEYTDYFTHILTEWSPDSDSLVLVPCGSEKPIGASSNHQKKISAIQKGGIDDADIVAMSEPCVVVPPKYRLSIPAVNYDFPPKYTNPENGYKRVFNIFADRLSIWLTAMEYDYIYTYLITGHKRKFDEAVSIANIEANIIDIPGASYNPESDSYSGDMFKKESDVVNKVKAVLKYKSSKYHPVSIPEKYDSFYRNKFTCD